MAHSGAYSENAPLWYDALTFQPIGISNIVIYNTTTYQENNLQLNCPENISTTCDIDKCSAEISSGLDVTVVKSSLISLTWKMVGATEAESINNGINKIGRFTFNEGVTFVTYTATDNSGNAVSCSFSVIVTDSQLPEISVPNNISIGCNEHIPSPYMTLQAFLNAGGNASDNCNLNPATFKLESEQKSNSSCPYTITRTYQIADRQGNIGQAKQFILVEKETNPVVKEQKSEGLMLKSALANTITSTGTGGNWNDGTTWVGGVVPLPDDNVIIATGATVTLTTNHVCNDITISGTLNCGSRTLQVNGSWVNNGAFNAGTGTIEFAGSINSSISGSSTTTFQNLTLNKGNGISYELAVESNLTINNINFTNGVLRINNGTTGITDITNANNQIPKPSGLIVAGGILNTGNLTIQNEGLIQVSSGTANFGTNSGNTVHTQIDGAFIVTGGNVNIAGRLENTASGTLAPGIPSGITISNGTVTLSTVGNGLSNVGSLDITANGYFKFDGGTIVFQRESVAATSMDLGLVSGAGTKTTVGGTFQFGNASTPAGTIFNISSNIPLDKVTSAPNADLKLLNNLVINQLALNNNSTIDLTDKSLRLAVASLNTYDFPLDNGSGVSIPVAINLTGGTFAAGSFIEIKTIGSKHPGNSNTTNFLKRYWNVTTNGITNPTYNITATYADADITGDDSHIAIGNRTGLTWSKGNIANFNTNTISKTGVTGATFEFTGITSDPPTVTINNGASITICDGSTANLTTTITGDLITYLWSPATGLSAANIANPVASPTTNTTYTVTVTDGNGFTATDNIAVNVNLIPTVNSIGNQIVCNNTSTTMVTFAGTGTSYKWTNNNTAIGLGANGTGNIAAFNATNSTTSPITGTITVTPVYSNGGVDCNGSTKSFTITVNPTPTVNDPVDQTVCKGASTTLVNFTGTATSYTWTNNNTSIGLGASGTGNISAFTTTNNTTVPITSTITVTPVYSNGGVSCNGTNQSFTITVNPTPTVNDPIDQTICNGTSTALVNFTGTATSYNWTNSNTAIGLGGSGTGNIAAFNAINNTTNPITSTITVTPVYSNGGVNCSGTTQSFTITVTPSITANAVNTDPIKCFGGTANIKITATGGTPPYTFNFPGKPSNSTGIFSGVTGSVAGTNYNWSVTDALNCAAANRHYYSNAT